MKKTLKPTLAETLAGRSPITTCPTGSPLAGRVTVRSLATGDIIRYEMPWTPDRRDTPGNSIEMHVGSRWAQGNDPLKAETCDES